MNDQQRDSGGCRATPVAVRPGGREGRTMAGQAAGRVVRGDAVIPTASSSREIAAFLFALGKRVRLLRLTSELTQDQLAVKAGMSRSFVSLIEHGKHGIDIARLARLAAALDQPLSTLIRDTELRTEQKEHR